MTTPFNTATPNKAIKPTVALTLKLNWRTILVVLAVAAKWPATRKIGALDQTLR